MQMYVCSQARYQCNQVWVVTKSSHLHSIIEQKKSCMLSMSMLKWWRPWALFRVESESEIRKSMASILGEIFHQEEWNFSTFRMWTTKVSWNVVRSTDMYGDYCYRMKLPSTCAKSAHIFSRPAEESSIYCAIQVYFIEKGEARMTSAMYGHVWALRRVVHSQIYFRVLSSKLTELQLLQCVLCKVEHLFGVVYCGTCYHRTLWKNSLGFDSSTKWIAWHLTEIQNVNKAKQSVCTEEVTFECVNCGSHVWGLLGVSWNDTVSNLNRGICFKIGRVTCQILPFGY